MSQEALSETQFEGHLYHATKPRHLLSIEVKGLEARSASGGQKPGVYGFKKLEHAASYGGYKSVVVEYKPTRVQRDVNSYIVSDAVPPENIVKVHGPWA